MKVWKQTLCQCVWQVHSKNDHPSPPTSEKAGELPSSLKAQRRLSPVEEGTVEAGEKEAAAGMGVGDV